MMHPVLQNIFISFMHPVAVSDAIASGEAVVVTPPAAAADPFVNDEFGRGSPRRDMQATSGPALIATDEVQECTETPSTRVSRSDPSREITDHQSRHSRPNSPDHAQQLAEIERLLRLNDTSCERSLVEIAAEEDDVPLFLRRARRA